MARGGRIQHSTPVQVFAGSAGCLPYRASCLTLAPAKRQHGDSFIQPPPTLAWLFVGRLIAGTSATSFGIANAYIGDLFPPEKRAQNFGLMGAAFDVGFLVGPVTGGFLGEFGPRTPFFATAGLAFANALCGWLVLPETLRPENRRPFRFARANALGAFRQLSGFPVVVGLALAGISFFGYAFSPAGWMVYVWIVLGAGPGLVMPATNSIMSRQIPANAQGELQGLVGSVASSSFVVSPVVMAQLFAYFSAPVAPVYFPDAPFALAGLLTRGKRFHAPADVVHGNGTDRVDRHHALIDPGVVSERRHHLRSGYSRCASALLPASESLLGSTSNGPLSPNSSPISRTAGITSEPIKRKLRI